MNQLQDGSLTKKYIYGPGMDNPVAMIYVYGGTETWYYYYADALGNTRLMTDASGTPVESYTYDVYGQPKMMRSAGTDGNWLTEDVTLYNFSNVGNPYLFTARRWDGNVKLYYYRFRDYAPQLGRFLQTDPAGYIDTMNLYAYCGNNPVNFIDPWRLFTVRAGVGIGLAVQVSVGRNGGNWSVGFNVGYGYGAEIGGTIADTGPANAGVSITATGNASANAGGVGVGVSADGSYGANDGIGVTGNYGPAHGHLGTDGAYVDFGTGVGAMAMTGVGVQVNEGPIPYEDGPLDIPMTEVAPGIWRDDRSNEGTVTKSEG